MNQETKNIPPPDCMTDAHLQDLNGRTRRCNYPTVADLENELVFGDLSHDQIRKVLFWYKTARPSTGSNSLAELRKK